MHNKHSLLAKENLGEMNELALFAGTGGGILGGGLLGWRTVCAVERDAYAAQVLAQRQNDGILEAFPIWSDVCSFDGTRWRGIVDVVSGGFPCQDISAAGKGAGIEGSRSSMWKQMARIISEVQPKYAFVENSPMLTTRGLGTVLADLASMGFDAEWGVLSAADVGANHKRERIWILGYSHNNGQVTAEVRTSINDRGNNRQSRQKQTCKFKGSSEQHSQMADTCSLGWQSRRNHNGKHDRPITHASGELQNVADTESQRIRRLPECESRQEWNKPGYCANSIRSGENVADTMFDRSQRQRQIRSIERSSRLCSGTRSNEKQCICNASSTGFQNGRKQPMGRSKQIEQLERSDWWSAEPYVGRVANGVAFRVDRLKAIGNGQVPLCAATAFILLNERITK